MNYVGICEIEVKRDTRDGVVRLIEANPRFSVTADAAVYAGVDIGWHRDPSRIENIRDALAAQGRWGQKKGAGFYDYDEKRRPSPSPVVQGIIEDFRAKAGVEKRGISRGFGLLRLFAGGGGFDHCGGDQGFELFQLTLEIGARLFGDLDFAPHRRFQPRPTAAALPASDCCVTCIRRSPHPRHGGRRPAIHVFACAKSLLQTTISTPGSR